MVVGSAEDRRLSRTEQVQTEVFPLLMFAVGGMLIFPVSNNLLLMFVALEVLSLPLYLMAGMARQATAALAGGGGQVLPARRVRLGVLPVRPRAALRLRRTRSTCRRSCTRRPTSEKSDVLLYVGLALLLVGLFFKAGVAPFHSWTPDVYQGSPTPVTAFMAACTKVAAFGAILRVLYVGFSTIANGTGVRSSGRWRSRRWSWVRSSG